MQTNTQTKQIGNAKGVQLDRMVKAYILGSISNDGYEDTPYYREITTDKDKIQFLMDVFGSEHGFMVDRIGQQSALKGWISGLPSSFNIEYRNHEILNIAVLWGSIPADYTERQADKFLNNWFNLIAAKTGQLFRKYGD